jgi:TPR repeat protein
VGQVATAVAGIGSAFEAYADPFRENGVDGKTLLTLDESDLEELGVKKLHRKRLFQERELLAATGSLTPSFHVSYSHGSAENDGDDTLLIEVTGMLSQANYRVSGAMTKQGKEWLPSWKTVLGTASGVVVLFTCSYQKTMQRQYTELIDAAPLYQQAMAIRARKKADPMFNIYVITSSDADHGSLANPSAMYVELLQEAQDFGTSPEWNAFVDSMASGGDSSSLSLPPPTAPGNRQLSDGQTGGIEQAMKDYEEGQRWMHGYGNEVDENKAVSFFYRAAEAGYAPAAAALGGCCVTGRGVLVNEAEAGRWGKKAMEMGLRALAGQEGVAQAVAQVALGTLYCSGEGVEEDLEEAAQLYKKAAEAGDADAQFRLSALYYNGDGVEDEDEEEAASWCTKAAEQGHAEAQCTLGRMYEDGEGVEVDGGAAAKWYRKSADQRYSEAQYKLGCMYEDAQGVADAAVWYRKGAEKGHARAQYNYGRMCNTGEGVAEDKAEAAKWYEQAAEQGDADAQAKIGLMYLVGEGVETDKQKAARWYAEAAVQGNAEAQYRFGYMHFFGEGVAKDKKEAAKWYKKAAEHQGHAEAQYHLGNMYYEGQGEGGGCACAGAAVGGSGIAEDKKMAASWYLKSASQGNSDAQYMLGCLYFKGEGVAKDQQEAVKWYTSAGGQGNGPAQAALKRLGLVA